MKPAIKIKTGVGLDTYALLLKQSEEHRKAGVQCMEEFKQRCVEDYTKAEQILGDWLDSDSAEDRMDDNHPENWEAYNVMNDLCASLRYFSTRSA